MTQSDSILIVENEYTFNESLNRVLKKRNPRRGQQEIPRNWKGDGIKEKINFFFNKEKCKISRELEFYSKIAKLEPHNTKAHLKMGELYQKKNDRQKAVGEYLRAAEIFYKNALFPQAMAVYKQVLKQNPELDHVHLKIADIYQQMGFLGDAFYRYNLLLQQYNIYGEKEKAMEVMGLMAELDPRKFNLDEKPATFENIVLLPTQDIIKGNHSGIAAADDGEKEKQECFYDLGEALATGGPIEMRGYKEISTEKLHGFKEIFQELKETAGPSKAYPNFNYHMGVACREMGFIDEAIEQFQSALEKGQNPFEAATLLSWCFKEKGWWEEARQALERSLEVEEITEEKAGEIKKEMDFISRELEREKQTLGFLNDSSLNPFGAPEKEKVDIGFESGLKIQEALSA